METFGWSEHKVRNEITSAQGWLWYSWAMENRMTTFGAMFERTSPGYIQQEAKRKKK
jgi:hypothetical protein